MSKEQEYVSVKRGQDSYSWPGRLIGPVYSWERDEKGRPVKQNEFLAYDVEDPFGFRMYAQPDHLEPIAKDEWEKRCKAERKERESLSKVEGFATDIVFKGDGWAGKDCPV